MNKIKSLIQELEEKHCYKCNHFYEGFICGFELSANNEKDTIHDIFNRRKGICSLDNEPLELRKKIYTDI